MLKAKLARRPLWLITKGITKGITSRMDVFTTHLCGDRKALVVFGFEEEAQMFLGFRLATSGGGWRVRRTSVGELVSVLYGPCSETRKVVLDPVPGAGGEGLAEPLSMPRNDFLRFLLGEGVPSSLHLLPSQTHGSQPRVKHGRVA